MTLVVHTLDLSLGERAVWLCEELGLAYQLKKYKRNAARIPPLAELLQLHPTGSVPLIEDVGLDRPLAESGAVMEYLCQKHGKGKLVLPPSHPSYADFLYWFHWADASLQPVLSIMTAVSLTGASEQHLMLQKFHDRRDRALRMMDDWVKEHTWLAGEEFTVADVMVVYPLTTFRAFSRLSLDEYPGILEYLGRVGKREAYKTAMRKCDQKVGYAAGAEMPIAFDWDQKKE